MTSLGLRLYVAHFDSYNATYGSIGGMILWMLWLFLCNVALLIGAEINSVMEEAAGRPTVDGLRAKAALPIAPDGSGPTRAPTADEAVRGRRHRLPSRRERKS